MAKLKELIVNSTLEKNSVLSINWDNRIFSELSIKDFPKQYKDLMHSLLMPEAFVKSKSYIFDPLEKVRKIEDTATRYFQHTSIFEDTGNEHEIPSIDAIDQYLKKFILEYKNLLMLVAANNNSNNSYGGTSNTFSWTSGFDSFDKKIYELDNYLNKDVQKFNEDQTQNRKSIEKDYAENPPQTTNPELNIIVEIFKNNIKTDDDLKAYCAAHSIKISNASADMFKKMFLSTNTNNTNETLYKPNQQKLFEKTTINKKHKTIVYDAIARYEYIKKEITFEVNKIIPSNIESWASIVQFRKICRQMKDEATNQIAKRIEIICNTKVSNNRNGGYGDTNNGNKEIEVEGSDGQYSTGVTYKGNSLRMRNRVPLQATTLVSIWQRYAEELNTRIDNRVDEIKNSDIFAWFSNYIQNTAPSIIAIMITFKYIAWLTRTMNSNLKKICEPSDDDIKTDEEKIEELKNLILAKLSEVDKRFIGLKILYGDWEVHYSGQLQLPNKKDSFENFLTILTQDDIILLTEKIKNEFINLLKDENLEKFINKYNFTNINNIIETLVNDYKFLNYNKKLESDKNNYIKAVKLIVQFRKDFDIEKENIFFSNFGAGENTINNFNTEFNNILSGDINKKDIFAILTNFYFLLKDFNINYNIDFSFGNPSFSELSKDSMPNNKITDPYRLDYLKTFVKYINEEKYFTKLITEHCKNIVDSKFTAFRANCIAISNKINPSELIKTNNSLYINLQKKYSKKLENISEKPNNFIEIIQAFGKDNTKENIDDIINQAIQTQKINEQETWRNLFLKNKGNIFTILNSILADYFSYFNMTFLIKIMI